MIATTTKEWSFAAAQTNAQLQAVSATEEMIISYVKVICANSNTVDVAVRIGLATATLPTLTPDSTTGNAGMAMSHGGLAPGGGEVSANGGAPIVKGVADEDLRITCGAATGGSIRVIVGYRINDLTQPA